MNKTKQPVKVRTNKTKQPVKVRTHVKGGGIA